MAELRLHKGMGSAPSAAKNVRGGGLPAPIRPKDMSQIFGA